MEREKAIKVNNTTLRETATLDTGEHNLYRDRENGCSLRELIPLRIACVCACVRLEMVNTRGVRTVLILTRSAIKFHSLVVANLRLFKFLSSRAKIRRVCGRGRRNKRRRGV